MGNLLVTGSIFAWIRIRIKVWPGSITNVFLDPDPPPLILYVHVVVERGGEHGADGRLWAGPRRGVQGSHQNLVDAAASHSRHAEAPARARLEKVSDRCGRYGSTAAPQALRGHEVPQGNWLVYVVLQSFFFISWNNEKLLFLVWQIRIWINYPNRIRQ